MTTNIVTAKFHNSRRTTTRAITQYDYGQILRIEGIDLPDAYEVDFSNNQYKGDSKPQIGNSSGVKIPEEYIKTGQDIYAFIFLHAGTSDGETFYWIRIPNEFRPARTNIPPTPEEESVIDETIAALNAGVEKVEGIADSMEEQIQDALQEAKDSGEFDGEDGFSPEITVESIVGGHHITIVDAEGSTAFDIMDGVDGEDGRGIVSVEKTGTSGLIDTYTITYTDGTTTTFTVTNGKDGEDGKSPVANVVQTSSGARITITDTEGTTTAEVVNGQDGFSPVATVSKSGDTSIITITDKNGTTTASVNDGEDGAPGTSPTITITDIPNGHRITITDVDHPQGMSFDVMNGEDGQGAVQDVQVNGTSVLVDGVANVPLATNDSGIAGVVKVNVYNGLTVGNGGILGTNPAYDTDIKGGSQGYKPICPSRQHQSTFFGLSKAAGDTTQSQSSNAVGTYTDSAKSAIHEMLNGSVPVTGSTPSINALPGICYVCGEVATLDITLPASGIVDVVFESGSTATVLTITPPTGQTVKWTNGFDPNALATNTTYEINIADGLGVAAAWT